MLRTLTLALVLLASTAVATTLEQLSLDEMISKSTGVVRGRVTASRAAARGADIYTYYSIAVAETWKGAALTQWEVAVPGGALRGQHQTVAGAPDLKVGEEYVLFLWTSRAGLTQVIGLSQGLFEVRTNPAGNPILLRPASSETLVDRNGRLVEDQPMAVGVTEMRSRVRGTVR